MSSIAGTLPASGGFVREKILLGLTPREYLRSLLTPFTIVTTLILMVGIPSIVYRFVYGLGASTNLTQASPWGIWIGFDVLCGVATSAGGFVLGTAVFLFGAKKYYPIVRAAVLTGFLGYFFVVVGLLVDLGQPWRLPYPIFYSPGVTSVLFLVAWHVMLYLSVQLLEFCPAIFEWLNWPRARRIFATLTIGATVFGAILSTLHQSAIGGLFLMMPTKVHPLWYSSFIPVFFFTSAIVTGMTMVIFESSLSHKLFQDRLDPKAHVDVDGLTLGLGKAAGIGLFTYFTLKLIGIADGHAWSYLATPMGYWFLVELIGFVALPCALFVFAVRNASAKLVRVAAVWTVLGIILNRLNLSLVAYNWDAPVRYVPHWMEIATTVTIVTLGILSFRWIVNRMPVLRDDPVYGRLH